MINDKNSGEQVQQSLTRLTVNEVYVDAVTGVKLENDEDFEIESESKIAPIDRIVIPKDVVSFSEEDESIHVVGTRGGKVTKIAGLENMNKLKVIIN